MPTITLQHCVPVSIFQSDEDADVSIDVTVGGVPTDGAVAVAVSPPPIVPIPPILCGTGATVYACPARSVTLHYVSTPLGPQTVEVEYVVHEK
jgi:hypothetical protein